MLSRLSWRGKITLVDPNPDLPGRSGCEFIKQDGITFCSELEPDQGEDWIIPALPLHLAYKWLQKRLYHRFKLTNITLHNDILNKLPNVIAGREGRIYTSIADFLCPPDCPEPKNHCYRTGRKREYHMFEFIAELGGRTYFPIVIRSHQMAPGVGGFQLKTLFETENKVLRHPAKGEGPVLLATSCRCHAVIDAFFIKPSV